MLKAKLTRKLFNFKCSSKKQKRKKEDEEERTKEGKRLKTQVYLMANVASGRVLFVNKFPMFTLTQ